MASKAQISQIVWLRAIACVSVVLIHSISFGIGSFKGSSLVEELKLFKMVLLFATPAFVFITEFLNSRAYGSNVPKNFLSKRLKVLLIPYVILGMIYPFIGNTPINGIKSYFVEISRNIIFGDSITYFIVIVMQFHLLHMLFAKLLERTSPALMLLGSFLVTAAYLAFFNIVEPISFLPFSEWIWSRGYWIPFPCWLFYFSLGYYCGRHFEQLQEYLRKYRTLVFLAPVATYLLSLLAQQFTDTIDTSKRFDNLLFTTAMIMFIFLVTSNAKRIPKLVYVINKYSFSIYLLHLIFILNIKPFDFMNLATFIPLLFITAILGSIIISIFLNKIPYAGYIVGNVKEKNKQSNITPATEAKIIA